MYTMPSICVSFSTITDNPGSYSSTTRKAPSNVHEKYRHGSFTFRKRGEFEFEFRLKFLIFDPLYVMLNLFNLFFRLYKLNLYPLVFMFLSKTIAMLNLDILS